jgi:hypothetical protein
MKKIILETEQVSKSGNIALYPAMALDDSGCLGIAWYEYGSATETDRSDIWFCMQGASGMWKKPLNISGGISYNNGPSLVWMPHGEYWRCAWHSWRGPGKEPFIVGGDVTNIWTSKLPKNGNQQEAHMALASKFNTEYASLANPPGEGAQLLYYDRTLRRQFLTPLALKIPFDAGDALPGAIGEGQHGDLTFSTDGTVWIAYVGKGGEILVVSRSQEGKWGQPRRIDPDNGVAYARPKISICADGFVWVSCHSNTWESYKSRYQVRTTGSHLNIKIESDGSPGNHCWTCNAITLYSEGGTRTFSFGSDIFPLAKDVAAVTLEESLYERNRGYGFDKQPRNQLRKLGNNMTRSLFYDCEPATFRIRIPHGLYDVEVVHSSWIAPKSGTKISIDAKVLSSQLSQHEQDGIFVLKFKPGEEVQCTRISNGAGYDENRPSKIIHDTKTGRKYLAWTSYGPANIGIVHGSFSILDDGSLGK